MYEVRYTEQAKEGLKRLKRNEPQAYKKAVKLLEELGEHPTTGTGQTEPLKGNLSGFWSRRISRKHRLIYRVIEERVRVLVVNTYDHNYTGDY